MNSLLLVSQGFEILGLNISYYGLIMALAMIFGVICAVLICKVKNIDTTMPIDLALFALPCAIVGARIYYCIFNGVSSFLEIFEIWKGGLAIYGGVIGGFLGVLLCCKIKKYSLAKACDLAAPCLILGQAIGRIGCYFAGCCYGVETYNQSLQVFPISILIDGHWHLATFFYEAFLNIIGFAILMIITSKTKKPGITTSWYLIIYGLVRSVLEQFRDPAELLTIANTGLRVSQVLSFILVVVGIVLFVFSLKQKIKATEEQVEKQNSK
ncbi:MAG: prolipoprotein diacylglyceryl transferase [Clostridia bacterium]|nr:prolipoprotein diacylglyceryl transferase [Clostridia bacterium]